RGYGPRAIRTARFRVMNLTQLSRLFISGCLLLLAPSLADDGDRKLEPTRVWNDKDLAEWATPLAGLNLRPGHYSEREYYAAPAAEFFRTYPVYMPGREPAGYNEWLASRRPEPLLRPE